MNDHAEKWVAALRSGEYKQGKGCLSRDGYDCCLGVACKLFVAENPGSISVEEDELGAIRFDGETAILPLAVRDWLGLGEEEGHYVEDDHSNTWLSVLNDDGVPFEDIANIIEAQPEGLFQ